MLAEKMRVEQSLVNWLYRWIELKSFPGHFRNDFQGMGIFDSLCAGGSPCKRPVPGDQDRTDLFGIEIVEPLDNDIAGFPLVGALYLRSTHRTSDRNLAVEVVSMSCPEAGDRFSSLREGNCIARVRMDNGTDAGKSLEQPAMSGCIRCRT